MLLSDPGASGTVRDLRPLIAAARERGALTAVAADLLALTLLTPPGELGADMAVGTTQRFGVPLGFGGPHAGLPLGARRARAPAARQARRALPSTPTAARRYRLALQTREQHIRREKATSQHLHRAGAARRHRRLYAVYHGPDGLPAIARRAHRLAAVARGGPARGRRRGRRTSAFFDTVRVRAPGRAAASLAAARAAGSTCAASTPTRVRDRLLDETTTAAHARGAVGGVRRARPTSPRSTRPRSTRCPPSSPRTERLPDPPGVPRAPLGDRDAALPAPARRRATSRSTAR